MFSVAVLESSFKKKQLLIKIVYFDYNKVVIFENLYHIPHDANKMFINNHLRYNRIKFLRLYPNFSYSNASGNHRHIDQETQATYVSLMKLDI
jgi:hypothetical protein